MSKKLLRKKNVVLIIVVIVILGAGIFGVRYLISQVNQPVAAKLKVGDITQKKAIYTVNLSPKLETGQFETFDYPSGLMQQPDQQSGAEYQHLLFTARDVESWVLAISVETGGNGLSSDSGYNLRKNDPSEYTESQETVNGNPVVIMTDTNAAAFSKVAFMTHGDLVASISLVGDDVNGQEPVQTSFDMVLSSWQWLQ